jgi:hypothetical protein
MLQIKDPQIAVLAAATPFPQCNTPTQIPVPEPADTSSISITSAAAAANVQRLRTWVPQMVQGLESSRQQFISWYDTMAKVLISPQEVTQANLSSSAFF